MMMMMTMMMMMMTMTMMMMTMMIILSSLNFQPQIIKWIACLQASVVIFYHPISNMGSWNNCSQSKCTSYTDVFIISGITDMAHWMSTTLWSVILPYKCQDGNKKLKELKNVSQVFKMSIRVKSKIKRIKVIKCHPTIYT